MSIRSMLGAAVAGAALLGAAACAPSIRSERDAAIPVPRGATWAWENEAPPDTGRYIRQSHVVNADPVVAQRFRRAIEAVMDEKGFRRVDAASQPDFLLSYRFASADDGYSREPVPATAAVAYGWYGWGPAWGGYFFPRWGLYRRWGFAPWGWGWDWYGMPAWSFAAGPAYPVSYHTYGGYGETGLVVTLRLRSTGEVAFEGRYHTERSEARRMSQEKVQEIVSKMLKDLG